MLKKFQSQIGQIDQKYGQINRPYRWKDRSGWWSYWPDRWLEKGLDDGRIGLNDGQIDQIYSQIGLNDGQIDQVDGQISLDDGQIDQIDARLTWMIVRMTR